MKWLKSAMQQGVWPWLCAGSVALSLLMLGALLALLLTRGLGHFWPAALDEVTLDNGDVVAGEAVREMPLPDQEGHERLYFTGNRDVDDARWRWVAIDAIARQTQPANLLRLERRTWGDFIGYLEAVEVNGERFSGREAWQQVQQALPLPTAQRAHYQLTLRTPQGQTLRQSLAPCLTSKRRMP